MVKRSIPIKVIKKDKKYVLIKLRSSNSQMRVPREDFDERVEKGEYVLSK